MERSPASSRREFLGLGLSAALITPGLVSNSTAPGAEPAGDPWRGLKVGVATYSFSRLPLDAALKGLKKVGAKYASIKDAHLPMKSTAEGRKAVIARFREAGVTPLSCGVVTLSDSGTEIRSAFEYARDAGLPVLVCKPTRSSLADLDRCVKEFDIKVAIHNHGPEDKVWPSPYDAWEAIGSLDPRIGLCIDVGHTARCGVDPAEAIRKCATRLYDVHLKDLDSTGSPSRPVEMGRGVLDIRAILQALLDVRFAGHVGLEYEKDLNDPVPGVAESLGYTKGMLANLHAK